jgi:hypothetical protein
VRRSRVHQAQNAAVAGVRDAVDTTDRSFKARSPCPSCHTTRAFVVMKGHQATVRCSRCARFLYNAPRHETGARPRRVRTLRRAIRPSQQARILDRDHGRCILCGRRSDIVIAHLLSLRDGHRLGVTAAELYCDANLAAMCEACNIGLSHSAGSVSARTYVSILRWLVQSEGTPPDQTSFEFRDRSRDADVRGRRGRANA